MIRARFRQPRPQTVPARKIHARLAGGDDVGAILEDYPYLDPETIEAAVMYVAANPERGRPRRGLAAAGA